jgi:hypothetical protein
VCAHTPVAVKRVASFAALDIVADVYWWIGVEW